MTAQAQQSYTDAYFEAMNGRGSEAADNRTAWRAYCLLEKAIKKGPHVYLNGKIFDVLADTETALLDYLTKPVDKGGKGVYKVLFYCSADSQKELIAFNNAVQRFKLQFQAGITGDIEI